MTVIELDVMRLPIICLLSFVVLLSSCGSNRVEELSDDGTITATYETKDGLRHGSYTEFHGDGTVFEKSIYKEDQLHGQRYLYRETGELQTMETYENGSLEGLFEEYHLNGKVALTGLYVNNTMDGVWKKYTENGILVEEVTFKNNNENGPFVEYHLNGQLAAEGTYINGDNEHGLLKIYDDKGTMIKVMECDRGVCQTTWTKEDSKKVG